MVGDTAAVSVGIATGMFELHEDITRATIENNSSSDFNVLIFACRLALVM